MNKFIEKYWKELLIGLELVIIISIVGWAFMTNKRYEKKLAEKGTPVEIIVNESKFDSVLIRIAELDIAVRGIELNISKYNRRLRTLNHNIDELQNTRIYPARDVKQLDSKLTDLLNN